MDKKSKKICLLGASFSTNNMGVGALTAGTIQCILHQFPKAEIILLDYGKENATYHLQIENRTIPIQLLNIRFSKKFYMKNNISFLILVSLIIKYIPFKKIKNQIICNNCYLHRLSDVDIFVSIAGGDSFSDIYGIRRFFYVSLPQLLILFMGKNLLLLPQTYGPYKGSVARLIARYILNHSKVVYSRDSTGLELVKSYFSKNNGPEKFRFCYDVGFVVDPIKPDKMKFSGLNKNNYNIVGLNVSGLLFMGGYTQNNMFGLKINYREVIYDLIDMIVDKEKTCIFLIPHVFGTSEHLESDSVACDKIYNELKEKYKDRIFVAHERYNQNEIKYVIGLCDFFIGSRMHACIAALSQNIPAVGIAYSKKFYGVFESIGVESLVADPRNMTKKEILNIIDQAYGEKDVIHKKLEQKMPEVKNTVLNLFKEISNLE